MHSIALVVAAGRGQRFGGELPKQYARLGGAPVLRRTLTALAGHPGISGVRAVINPDDRALYDEAASGLDVMEPVAGGASRQDSVRNGLESLSEIAPDSVLIHDGARPFVSAAVIDRVLAALSEGPGAIAALPVTDTLKRAADRTIETTVPRAGLWRAQTPQGFRYAPILEAHRAAAGGDELTDDAAVAELAGIPVSLVEGTADNVKITTRDDLERAERALAAAFEYRSAGGYDVHRFGPGDHVMLCGVELAHDHGLIGHSDADVGLHAVTDALLGALAAGDIGSHFPPSDPQWRGAESWRFLRHACDLLAERGGQLVNADVTLICERPQDRPAPRRHGRAHRRDLRRHAGPHQRQGDDHRGARLHRPARRHRRPGERDGPPAGNGLVIMLLAAVKSLTLRQAQDEAFLQAPVKPSC